MKGTAKFDTRAVHAGDPRPRIRGAVAMPIFQSAQFEFAGETSYHDLKYIRLNNTPNHVALHEKIASLEGAEAGLVTGSGMAAITTAILTVVNAGDHVLAQSCLYGGTHDFVSQDLPRIGVEVDFVDVNDPDSWAAKVRPNTKVFYVESISNPLVQVGDLSAVIEFARQHNLVSMIDNTFATPFNYRAAEQGFDLSLHSATKYLNGHSDIVAGAIAGRAELVEQVIRKLNHLGGSLDPHACMLLYRGMKTLALRMRQHNHNALHLARFLEGHDAVVTVNYPGLESSPDHARAQQLFAGCSGALSFELHGGLEAARAVMDALEIPAIAPSLGGVESLCTLPATTSHAGMDPDERRAAGISDSLIRVSVGIEDVDDLVADFQQALTHVPAVNA